jgi:hypothetical protein
MSGACFTFPICRHGVCGDTVFHFYDKCIAACVWVWKTDESYSVHIDGSFPIPDRGLVCESRKQVGHLARELDSSSDSCRFLSAKRESRVTSWLVRARAVYVHLLGEVAGHKKADNRFRGTVDLIACMY